MPTSRSSEIVPIFLRVLQSEWVAELEFRATGPERGGGNLQLWYAKDGQMNIGTSSVYTVGNFDGMVLVIDSYGGKVQFSRKPYADTC